MPSLPRGNDLQRPRRGRRLGNAREDFFFGAELLLPAFGHHQDIVDAGDRARPMRDDDNDRAPGAQAENGARQRFVAFRVEIGVRFVKHDQERIAIKRARKRDPLRLAGRQRAAALADFCLVAVGQVDDQVVNARRLRRRQHRLGVRRILEARDVLRHVAGKQFHVLRQIADVPAERLRRPLIERRRRRAGRCRATATRRRPACAPATIFPKPSGR